MTDARGSPRTGVREAARALWLVTAATGVMAGLVFLLNIRHYGIGGAAAGPGLLVGGALIGVRAFRAPAGTDSGKGPEP